MKRGRCPITFFELAVFNCLQYSTYTSLTAPSALFLFTSCLSFGILTVSFILISKGLEPLVLGNSSSTYVGRRRSRVLSLIPQARRGLFYSVGKTCHDRPCSLIPRPILCFSGRSLFSFHSNAARDDSFRREGVSRLSSGSFNIICILILFPNRIDFATTAPQPPIHSYSYVEVPIIGG